MLQFLVQVPPAPVSTLPSAYAPPPDAPPALLTPQNAAPDGPSAYAIADVIDRTLRWSENATVLRRWVMVMGVVWPMLLPPLLLPACFGGRVVVRTGMRPCAQGSM